MKKTYGILAFPAKHSLSPAIQNAAFKAAGVEAEFGYFEISPQNLTRFFKNISAKNIYGMSVSAPHKEAVIKFLDSVSADAKKIGAVNTIARKGTKFYGFNTDFIGAVKALKTAVKRLKGKQVVILGAGGAARAIAYGLTKEKAFVTILNRHEAAAKKIAKDFGGKIATGSLKDLRNVRGDILIQSTSVWFNKNLSQKELDDFCPDALVKNFNVVMDIVYKPLKTPLIKKALRFKKKIVTGDEMFFYQAVEQFKIWTNKKAPQKEMLAALKKS